MTSALASISSHKHWKAASALLATLVIIACSVVLGRALLSPHWTTAATLIGMSSVILVMLVKPAAGMLLWIFLIPFAEGFYLKISLGDLPDLDISRVAMLLLAFLLVAPHILRRAPRESGAPDTHYAVRSTQGLARLDWSDVAMWGFMAGISLSVRPALLTDLTGSYAEIVLKYIAVPLLMYFFAPWLVFYLSRNWLRSRQALMAAVGTVALSSALLGIISTQEQLTGMAIFSPVPWSYMAYEGSIRKVLSLFGTPTLMTTALATAVPFVLYGVQAASTLRRRLLFGLALILTLVGDFFVFVRAGWVAALSGILVMVLLDSGIRRVIIRLLPVILVLGLVIGSTLVAPQVVEKRTTSDASIGYRLIAWEIAWDLFRKAPLGGIGYHGFGDAAMTEYGWRPHDKLGEAPAPHNSILYVMVSGGLIAAIPYIAIFGTIAWRGFTYWRSPRRGRSGKDDQRDRRRLVAALWATLLGNFAISMTLDSLNGHYTNVLLFLILGTILGRLEGMNSDSALRSAPAGVRERI